MNYDVTPHIIAHMYPQMRKGSANSARCIVEIGNLMMMMMIMMMAANSASWGGDMMIMMMMAANSARCIVEMGDCRRRGRA